MKYKFDLREYVIINSIKMCLLNRKRRHKKNKIYPKKEKKSYNYIQQFTTDEKIYCRGCNELLPMNSIKIHCAGCHEFFHCKIAGTCYGYHGKPCIEGTTADGHNLSWCILCVPGIEENKIRQKREDPCICKECFLKY